MDLVKIGKFIASLRKDKNLTQEELAEKLYVTDRAVSKWERVLSLPDAGKMLDLCNILGINVNELLNGEKINMKDYEKKTEELLVEMAKQDEAKNKKLMANMWAIAIFALLFYAGIITLACVTLEEGPVLGTVILLSTALLVIAAFYAFKIEVDTGYYECVGCHEKFTMSYFKAMISPHIGLTRLTYCPKCHKIHWAKKVMTK